jgi:hypothetical protein
MALKDGRSGREYDKFVADGSGDTSLRVTTTTSVTTSASNTSQAVATGNATASPKTGGTVILTEQDVAGKERIGIQIFNTGTGSAADKLMACKVYGSLKTSPGTVGGSDWTQIGDDIAVVMASSTYKAIATTPVKSIGIWGCTVTTASTTDVYIMAD